MSTTLQHPQQKSKKVPHKVQKRLYAKFLKKPVVVHLTSGVKVKGKLTEYDEYTLAVSVKDEEVMIFKHAIALIRPDHTEV
ncbi:RNA chaperone Hfq [Cytobacillus sp. FSL R5-0596]|uniref:RNA chaperone Hfq n=1 Tax=Cytobacillus sp. FSL R5-0596 TaxID=2954696 RepID=UPI0030F5506D